MLSLFSKLSSFQKVVFGLVAGVIVGILVGEPAGHLNILGNIYVRLLQMTVLPYLLMSIIGGLGRLDMETAAKIGIRAGALVLFIWMTTMLTNLLLPLAYPNWEAASFFSASLTESGQSFDFLTLYIPSNIFTSLSETIVPSVVLFCLLLGSALIKVKEKKELLNSVANIAEALMNMASFVAKLAPYGIFAISASAAGTLEFEELGRLQIFIWAYLTMWGLMTFLALPLFISWATPFRYSDMRKLSGEAMVTAFATGTVLVVLPMIADRCKSLLKQYELESKDTDSVVDVMVPTAYSFPSVGTLMGLGFVLFSGWYLGSPIAFSQYPSYLFMGTLSAFGSMPVAIPFLLDFYNLPADQFQLYLLGSVITARFATAMAALHGFVICLLVASSVLNKLKWRRLFNALGIHLVVSAATLAGLGLLLGSLIKYEYKGDKSFEAMTLMGAPVSVVDGDNSPLSALDLSRSRLDVIMERGTLRVGYSADDLPYVFRNEDLQITGYDMDLVHSLARDLDLSLEIVKLDLEQAPAMLNDGRVDLMLGGVTITPKRALDMAFSIPYTEHVLGFLVKDSRRDEFQNLDAVLKMTDLVIAVEEIPYYKEPLEEVFANAEIVGVPSPRSFVKGLNPNIDALVFPVEIASAWTLLYPDYSVVVPPSQKLKTPAGIGMPLFQTDFVDYINTWLRLKESNGYLDRLYDYWILGINPKKVNSRWSVIKDVFGWGNSPDETP